MNIESVQRAITKIIAGCENLSYKDRLKKLKLTTLLERRMRGDLIETFKILNDKNNYGKDFLNVSSRTGNLLSRPISQTKTTKQLDFFLIEL